MSRLAGTRDCKLKRLKYIPPAFPVHQKLYPLSVAEQCLSDRDGSYMVELVGLEPTASSLRTTRSAEII
jgi:hypothetical protein